MQNKIVKIGRTGLVALITLLSMIISVCIYSVSFNLAGKAVDSVSLLVATFAPALIAPTVTWHAVKLLIKINQLEGKMRRLATFDILTGVMTRRAFLSHCNSIYHLMQRDKLPLSLIYIDIDDFKKINDQYGHAGGDAVLKSFGSMINHCKRKSDLVGRMGGEEFIVALPDTDLQGAMQFSHKIRNLVKEPAHHKIAYTVSIGVTVTGSDKTVDLEKLIGQADEALYQAKNAGRDCVTSYPQFVRHELG